MNQQEETYYHCIAPKDSDYKIWAFDDYSHLFSRNNELILAKPVYCSINAPINFDFSFYRKKALRGEEYINLIYKTVPGQETRMNSDNEIKALITSACPGIDRVNCYYRNPFSSSFISFNKGDVVDTSSPRKALSMMKKASPQLDSIISLVEDTLNVSESQIGVTGSLALGAEEVHDYDIVFYGNIVELNQIQKRISAQITQNGPVFETGLKWPCRYYDRNGNIICCFFNIEDSFNLDPAFVTDSFPQNQRITFQVRVADDSFSIAKVPILLLEENEQFNVLVIFSRAFRGVFKSGDTISGVGNISADGKTILCFDPANSITDWIKYFNR